MFQRRRRRIDFAVVGAAKCGTTSLHHYLHQHPALYMPNEDGEYHESGYFLEHSDQDIKGLTNRAIRRDLDDAELFDVLYPPDASRGCLLGDESTDYTKHPHRTVDFDRLRRHNPKMRIIMMVRDPYDRVISHYHHYRRRRPMTVLDSFDDEIRANPMYADISQYHTQLQPFVDIVGAHRTMVVRLEDLADHGPVVMSRVFSFLGVDTTFQVDFDPRNVGAYERDDDLYDRARRLLGASIEEDQRRLDESGLLLRV